MDLQNRLDAFGALVDATFDPDDISTLFRCDNAFGDLARSHLVTDFINRELSALRDDPLYIGKWQSHQIVLHQGGGYALTLSLSERARRYVHTSPHLALLCPVGGAISLGYDIFELPPEYRNDLFDPTIRLQRVGSGTLERGEVRSLNAQRYVYDLRIEKPVLLLRLSTSPFQTMEWLFNRESLYAWQANDAEVNSTQARVAAYLLGRLAHQSSLEPLKHLTRHPHHAVRWSAIQAIGRLSRSEAVGALQAALDDPHPHIRRAAESALKKAG